MDFTKTDEQQLLIESLRTAYERADLDLYLRECDEQHIFPEKAVQAMIDEGFHLVGVPEEYGGAGADMLTQCMLLEEVARLGFPPIAWPNAALEIVDITSFGNKEQQDEIIGIASTGKKAFTLGFSEPQAGSDSAAIACTATRRNGKVYINGQKTFNTDAQRAKYMLCVVRDYKSDNPTHDMTMWMVPLDAPGVTILPIKKIGNRATETCDVFLEDVEVEEKDLVGKEGMGFIQLMMNFEAERLVGIPAIVGMAQRAYEDATKWAGERVQFGKTIGSFQLVQEMIVNMAIKVENMRNMLYKCAWMFDKGENINTQVALTKLYCAQAGFEVVDDAMQVMGGIGYTDDCLISRMWRDMRAHRIWAGTDQIMIHVAGRALVKSMKKSR